MQRLCSNAIPYRPPSLVTTAHRIRCQRDQPAVNSENKSAWRARNDTESSRTNRYIIRLIFFSFHETMRGDKPRFPDSTLSPAAVLRTD